jgi:hypothetical protein
VTAAVVMEFPLFSDYFSSIFGSLKEKPQAAAI